MRGLLENQILQRLVSDFPRDSRQLNAFLESDAELLPINEQLIIAITTDSIVEEIETGLYTEPFLIGWMTVMASLSDLAAVGAQPLGLVVLQHLPNDLSPDYLSELQKGIAQAAQVAGTYILGGDTNTSGSLQMGATALGLIDDGKTITRIGCKAGDLLYVSDYLGSGNAFAFSKFFAKESDRVTTYRPVARLKEGALIRKYGTACIDTSDGFFPAIANLMEINGKGFKLYGRPLSLVAIELQALAESSKIPPWFFLAGPHGEFELLFTIAPNLEEAFLQDAGVLGWQPIPLGKVTENAVLDFSENDKKQFVNPFLIANLFAECGGNPSIYLQKLLQFNLYEKQDKESGIKPQN